MPSMTETDTYECRHGLGYSRFHSSKNKLEADLLAFVPSDVACEINCLKLKNNSDSEKISLFSYVEFCLWNAVDDGSNFQRNLSIGEVEVQEAQFIIKQNTEKEEDITASLLLILRFIILIQAEMLFSALVMEMLFRSCT